MLSQQEEEIGRAASGFISRIGSEDRGSRQVNLFHRTWNGTLVDPAWISGALQTTALRKRPTIIPKPYGTLGYSAGKKQAAAVADNFRAKVASGNIQYYENILFEACDEMESEMNSLGFHWTFGRSQKFFNILAKYWFCVAVGCSDKLQESDRALVKSLRNHFHAPIDSITLRHVRKLEGAPPLDSIYWGWSMSREIYGEIQKCIESRAARSGLSKIEYELVEIW